MKRITYLKTLLVGLCAMGAISASAQTTTTLLEYGTSDVPWTAEKLTEWTAGGSPTLTDGIVTISGGNGSYETSKTIAPTAYSKINVTAVWRGRSNTGRAFSAGNGSFFRFGNIIVAQNDQDKKHGYGFTGLANISSVTTFTAGSYRTEIENCTWLLIEMEINTASNMLTSFTIKSEDGNTTYASAEKIALADADYTTVAFGYHKSGGVNTENKEQLKSIKITQTTQPVQTANYAVKYICNNTEVKEAATRSGVVGGEIALTASDTQSFYANNKKYIYVSDDVEGKTVAEGAVVTVTFREAEVYSWTAKSSVGNYTTSGETFEGDKASVKYPLYQLVEGKLWTKTANDKVFVQNYDVTENNQEFTLEYTETEIDNVVFYAEVEDIEGMSVVNSGNAEARSSQRASGYSASGRTAITSLSLGKYQMYACFYSPTSAGGTYDFFAGNRNIWHATTSNNNATDLNQEIVLAKENNEILLGQTGATAAVDFIYIQKLADPTSEELAAAEEADYNADHVKATIGSNGYTTFASSENVSLPSGVTAYTAEVSGNYVNFTKVENGEIPANTGVLLEGTAGEITLDVVATATALGTNDFKVNTSGATFAVAENTTYFAMVKDSDPLKFGTVNPSSVAIPANKAYLAVVGNSEARLTVTFDGETTAIKSIENAEAASNAIYNLNGQRVEKAQKGLYIVNGKKTIVK